MIGLAGSHRTGKTTLARAYAEKHQMPFVATSASAVFQMLGLDPKKDYPFDMRLAIQKEILNAIGQQYRRAGVRFITDRTPIDMLAYTLADVQRETVTPELNDDLANYVNACFDVANEHFTSIVVVQPGIPLAEEAGKAPATKAYMEHINLLVLGAVCSEACEVPHYFIPRDILDLERRISCIEWACNNVAKRHQEKMEALVELGERIH